MLVEFRVKNFRSFRDEQVLSFVAANDKSLRDTNTITTGRNEAPFCCAALCFMEPMAAENPILSVQ